MMSNSSPASLAASVRFNILGEMTRQLQHQQLSFLYNNKSVDESPLDFSKKKVESSEGSEEEEEELEVDEESSSPQSSVERLRTILSLKMKPQQESLKEEGKRSHAGSMSTLSSKSSSPILSPCMQETVANSPVITSFGAGGMGGANLASGFVPWGNLSPQQQLAVGFLPLMDGHSPQGPVGAAGAQFLNYHQQQQMQQHQANANNAVPNGAVNPNAGSGGGKARVTRPFKAYPKDPMSFSAVGMYGFGGSGASPGSGGVGLSEALFQQQSQQAYAEFRKQMLSSSQVSRGRRPSSLKGSHHSEEGLTFSHSHSDQPHPLSSPSERKMGKSEQQLKDEAYWERRRKNNEAAKRSRDARRAKEDEIAIRAAFLEQENMKLRIELCALKSEAAKLRCMLYSN